MHLLFPIVLSVQTEGSIKVIFIFEKFKKKISQSFDKIHETIQPFYYESRYLVEHLVHYVEDVHKLQSDIFPPFIPHLIHFLSPGVLSTHTLGS